MAVVQESLDDMQKTMIRGIEEFSSLEVSCA